MVLRLRAEALPAKARAGHRCSGARSPGLMAYWSALPCLGSKKVRVCEEVWPSASRETVTAVSTRRQTCRIRLMSIVSASTAGKKLGSLRDEFLDGADERVEILIAHR